MGTANLIVCRHGVRGDARLIDRHGDGRARVLAETEGHRVVRQHAIGHRIAQRRTRAADEAAVEILDGLELEFQVLRMRNLVRRLDMHIDEIIAALDGLDGGIGLAFVVGVDVTRCAGHLDDVQPHRASKAIDDVHGGDNRTFHAITLGDGMDGARFAARPQPDAVCRPARQHLGGTGSDVAQDTCRVFACGRLGARQVFGHGIAAVVVRLVVRDGRPAERRAVQQQQVAVGYACVEPDEFAFVPFPGVGDLRIQKRNGLLLLGRADVATGKVRQRTVGRNRHKVHAEDDIVRSHRNALRSGFERTTPAQLLCEIAAQDGHVGHVRRRGEAFRQRQHLAAAAVGGNPVHVRHVRGLKRRLAVQRRQGFVGHAIAEKENGFAFHRWRILYQRTPPIFNAPPLGASYRLDGKRLKRFA